MKTRKRLLGITGIFCFLAALLSGQSEERPNIIFILTDDMGYADYGAAGNPYIRTPNIDRLAAEGTTFTNFHVNSAVCAPSRVAFTTGIFPARLNAHHIYLNEAFNREHGVPPHLDPGHLTVADVLKDAGYATAHIGKWHLGGRSANLPSPDAYGFDFALVTHGGNQSPIYRQRWRTTEHPVTTSSHWIVDDAIDYLKRTQSSDQPFYLNLWTLVPHGLLLPTEEELRAYEGLNARADAFDSWMAEYAQEAGDLNSQMQIYAAAMTSTDAAIGRLFTYLEDADLMDNTIIIFSSDNGPEDYNVGDSANAGMGSPGVFRGRKRSPYLGGMRVPMIVRWPGHTPKGVENAAIWSAVDFLPTLAAISGSEVAASIRIDGENVAPILNGSQEGRQQPLFWEWKFEIFGNEAIHRAPQVAMLDGKWWAGWNPDGSRIELYDLSSDPEQRNNVKDHYPAVTERMVDAMRAWKDDIPEAYMGSYD